MADKTSRKYISVCIPTYEMRGLGPKFLKHNFDILCRQTFTDFDVVISDNSRSDVIKKVCDKYQGKLAIRYFKNPDYMRAMSTNINNTIKKATGKLIKILFLDDFLLTNQSLSEIATNFDLEKDHWLVTGFKHTKDGKKIYKPKYPSYNDKVYLGENTIGSPSVLTIKNDHPLLFDVKLKWLVDCDYYKRCFDTFGSPKILRKITTVIRTGAHQITNTEATELVRKREFDYMVKKHHPGRSKNLNLKNVTLVAVSGIDPDGAQRALELSMVGIDYYDQVVISHRPPRQLHEKVTFRQCQPTELASTDPKNKDDYSKFMAYNLGDYIDSEFALIVHNDAYVLRPKKWRPEFFDYDYIGAPWPKDIHFDSKGNNVRVGNGGFSFRSKKLLNILDELKLPFTDNGTGYYNEDGILCVYYRQELEQHGIKFAPVPVAAAFSLEKECDDSNFSPFGFHNNKRAIPRLFFAKQALRKWLTK